MTQPQSQTQPHHRNRNRRGGRRRESFRKRDEGRPAITQQNGSAHLPQLQRGKIRIIPLGGLEGIGANCTIVESDDTMVLVDVGLMFPHEGMPGIDYVIPNMEYVERNRKKLKAIFLTHGHLDHIGALPYLIERIGNPPIYGSPLAIALAKLRLEEFGLDRFAKLHAIRGTEPIRAGSFTGSMFLVNHNIPDSDGLALETPAGRLVFTGDFKFDHTPQDGHPADFGRIASIGNQGVLCLFSDSTNVEHAGYTPSEKEIGENLDRLFAKTKGRIIVSTFPTIVSRLQQIIESSIRYNRKFAFSGLSMEKTVRVAVDLGFLKFPKEALVKLQDIDRLPDNRVTVISTGSQGQDNSALGRMGRGEHKHVQIRKGDTVILSSSPIPGNERAIQTLMSALTRLGARVVHNKMFDIHASGHAYQGDLRLMLSLVRPKHFVPVHGEHFMLVHHAELAAETGVEPSNAHVLENGNILEFNKGQATLLKERVTSTYTLVDGLGVGDVGEVVLRERQALAADGMVVIVLRASIENKKIIGKIEIISHGFVYSRGSERLFEDVKRLVQDVANQHSNPMDFAPLRNRLRDDVGLFLFKKTERRPMVIPIIIDV
ncbi:MAG: ribonuclease J [Candidatus Kerfeldbacteria bacterium]|nr:ribonuclease J [Candidatus Kerfeldbacteria bacterium]